MTPERALLAPPDRIALGCVTSLAAMALAPAHMLLSPACSPSLGVALVVALVALALALRSAMDRELGAALFPIAAALWSLPLITFLPDSPASGGMPFVLLVVVLGTAWGALRMVGDRRHALARPWRKPWRPPVIAMIAATIVAWCTEGLPEPLAQVHPFGVRTSTRVESIVLAWLFALGVVALVNRERARTAALQRAVEANVVEPGSAQLETGERIRVAPELSGTVVVLSHTDPSASYRDDARPIGEHVLSGTRAALLAESARRSRTLELLALSGALTIASPASADLAMHLVDALAEAL